LGLALVTSGRRLICQFVEDHVNLSIVLIGERHVPVEVGVSHFTELEQEWSVLFVTDREGLHLDDVVYLLHLEVRDRTLRNLRLLIKK